MKKLKKGRWPVNCAAEKNYQSTVLDRTPGAQRHSGGIRSYSSYFTDLRVFSRGVQANIQITNIIKNVRAECVTGMCRAGNSRSSMSNPNNFIAFEISDYSI